MRSPMRRRVGTDEVAIAYRVLSLMDGKDRGRRVGALVLDHFNRTTGQCDPSIARIAKILGVERTTVFRALTDEPLCLLFRRDSHGGHSHRNSYAPDWPFFRAISEAFDAARDAGMPLPKVAEVQRSWLQLRNVDGCSPATQTYKRNLHNKPTESPRTSTRQRSLPLLQVVGGTQALRHQAMREQALLRIDTGVREAMGGDVDAYAKALGMMTDQLLDQAVEVESGKRGSGVLFILQALTAAQGQAGLGRVSE